MPRKVRPERSIRVLKAHSNNGVNYIFVLKYHGILINSMRFNAETAQVKWPSKRDGIPRYDSDGFEIYQQPARFPLITPHRGTTRRVQEAMWIFLATRMFESLPATMDTKKKLRAIRDKYRTYPRIEYDSANGFYFPSWRAVKKRDEADRLQAEISDFERQVLDESALASQLTFWRKRHPSGDLEDIHREFVRERCEYWRKFIGPVADFDKIYPQSKAIFDRLTEPVQKSVERASPCITSLNGAVEPGLDTTASGHSAAADAA